MIIKPKILTIFLSRRFLSGLSLVLLIISGIIFAITFIEKLPRTDGILSAANISFVSLMEYIPLFLPLAVFMGTLLTCYKLTRSSESVILSGAGMSPWQKIRPFLITAFIIGVFTTTIVNPYAISRSARAIDIEKMNTSENSIWIRESGDTGTIIIRANGVEQNKRGDMFFSDASVILLGADTNIEQRIETDKITLDNGGFFIKHGRGFDEYGVPGTIKNWSYVAQTTPNTFLERHLKPDQISFWKLPRTIKNMQKIGLYARGHWSQFWTLLFLPLTLIAMTTLGFAFSQTRERRNFSFGIKFGGGILISFGLYFLTNVFSALGTSGALPTILAAALPPLLITTFAAMWIVSFEAI
ncbi:MAG: LptF/LptG family permease [Rickettsiales bacterium]|jgi:lipopolysaccharide export system permease protein|nr:LptF/LptG family permease [Rickettsiales bacterium]